MPRSIITTTIGRCKNSKGKLAETSAQLPNMNNPQLYILNQSLEVTVGTAAPWFGQYGGGTQYLLPQAIRELLALEIISKYP